MGIKLKKEGRIPSEFWEDKKWALEHYAELRRKYADMWVAIVLHTECLF